jgi:predicted ATP-grasp superfamily ATP-dependent carboligase
MPTVLLTLGRLPKALDVARSFSMQGWRVVVAEPYRRHLCGASRHVARSAVVPAPAAGKRAYLEALARIATEEQAELIVPVSEEAMHVAFLPPLLPASVRVLVPPPERLLPLYDKGGFARLAREYGLTVPETHALGSAEAAALAAAGDVVVKPIHSCAGRGVRILRHGEALPMADQPHVVQRFVPGEVYSSCSIAQDGQALGTAIYRGVTLSGSVAVAFERVEGHAALEAWIARFIAASGHSGFISFDFVVDEAGVPWGIECNPRTTSGLHFFETANIAPALIDGQPLRHRAERRLQQFWSCLTETQHRAFRPGFTRQLRQLLTTRDVTWSWRDPLPLLTMPFTAWPIIAAARAKGVPFGEVATLDVGWFEGETSGARGPIPTRGSQALGESAHQING